MKTYGLTTTRCLCHPTPLAGDEVRGLRNLKANIAVKMDCNSIPLLLRHQCVFFFFSPFVFNENKIMTHSTLLNFKQTTRFPPPPLLTEELNHTSDKLHHIKSRQRRDQHIETQKQKQFRQIPNPMCQSVKQFNTKRPSFGSRPTKSSPPHLQTFPPYKKKGSF